MPRRRMNRRRRRRRRKNRSTLSVIPMNRVPFPKSMITKLRFVNSETLNASASSIGWQHYSANSAFDPKANATTGDHQPLGWDQYAALYDKYIVLGAKCTVEFLNVVDNNTLTEVSRIGIALTTDKTPSTDPDYLDTLPSTVSAILTPQIGYKKLVKKYSAKKFNGVTNVKDNDELGALTTASPSHQDYFQVFQAPIVTSGTTFNDPAVIEFRVQIDYIVMFRDPKQFTKSDY